MDGLEFIENLVMDQALLNDNMVKAEFLVRNGVRLRKYKWVEYKAA